MLNGKTIAVAVAIAILGMGTHASAYTIDLTGSADGAVPSDIVILNNSITVDAGENLAYTGWDWSIQCTGCVMTGYNFVYVFANFVSWNGAYSAANVDPPSQLDGPNTFTQIGSFNGAGLPSGTTVVGTVTLHITSASGTATPYLRGGEGFANAGVVTPPAALNGVAWVPEPGTAMLLALGLSGLGVMGRRNR